MNILLEKLPNSVVIDGIEYEIETDYKFHIYTTLALESNDLTGFEKMQVVVRNFFVDKIPDNMEAIAQKYMWFLNGGEMFQENNHRKVFSFEKDAKLIFSGFKQTFGIDLQETDELHWWKFLSYLQDFAEDSAFRNLTALRQKYYAGKTTQEENQVIHELGDIFEIKEMPNYTLEEREIILKVREGYKKAKQLREAQNASL